MLGCAGPINVNLDTHGRARRIRWGRFFSSKLRARVSVAGAARFASRSWICKIKQAVARVPIATVGSPRSRRQRVTRQLRRSPDRWWKAANSFIPNRLSQRAEASGESAPRLVWRHPASGLPRLADKPGHPADKASSRQKSPPLRARRSFVTFALWCGHDTGSKLILPKTSDLTLSYRSVVFL